MPRIDRNYNNGVLHQALLPNGLVGLVASWRERNSPPSPEEQTWLDGYAKSLANLSAMKEAKRVPSKHTTKICNLCQVKCAHQSALDVHQAHFCPNRPNLDITYQCRGVTGSSSTRCSKICYNPMARDRHETGKHQLFICKDENCSAPKTNTQRRRSWCPQADWHNSENRTEHMKEKGM